MRKRSGAMSADNEETYLKLAKLAQKSDSLYYSDNVQLAEEIQNCKSNQLQISPTEDNTNYNFFEFNLSNEDFELENDEKICLDNQDSIKKIIVNIMILGDSRINKKSFVDSCFEENLEILETNSNSSEYCLDLIIKEMKINEKALDCTCKFWVKNLDEIKFDNIVQAYYKSINSFLFLYDENNPNTFNQLQKVHETIINSRAGVPLHATLLTIRSDLELENFSNDNNYNNFDLKYQTTLNNFLGNQEIMKEIIKNQI